MPDIDRLWIGNIADYFGEIFNSELQMGRIKPIDTNLAMEIFK